MSPVRIVDVSYVAVPADGAPPPEPIKLNAMEAQWVALPLLQHVLFFDGDQLPPFDAVLQSLKSSLAATLATYRPLAGKLVHLADTGDVAISCSSSDAVKFVVTESDADVRRLAGDEEQDVRMLERLVPAVDMTVLPAPVLAVQATRIEGGGGLALGVTVHHGVADGRSLWRFVEAWAAACRGDALPPAPVFDRSRVRLPGGQELARSVLRKYAPNLPVASTLPTEDRLKFTRRMFILDAGHIERLKQRIVRLAEAQGAPLPRPPSTFVAVIALTWTCGVRSRPFPADEDVFLFFFADVRNHLDPPGRRGLLRRVPHRMPPGLPARELRSSDHALAAAASAIQGAIREMVEDPVAGWDFLKVATEIPMNRFFNVSGSPGFRAYEVADFGWGRPRRTVPVRLNQDGQVALVRARDGDGVQVSVARRERAHMDAFKSEFLDLIAQ
ncbi:hypothetical protein EJB05_39834, partial [Eragrostis curvula]